MTRNHRAAIVSAAVAGCVLAGSGPAVAAITPTLITPSGTSPAVEITRDVRISDGPTVVVTPAGTTIAVWIQRNRHVLASSRPSGSQQWSEPTTVARNGFYATVATSGSDQAVVAWQGLGKSSSAFIRARTVQGGVQWGPTDLVDRWARRGGVTVALTVAANQEGKTLVAWTRGHRVRASYGAVGSGWSEPYTFSDNDAYSYEAVANVGPLGQADLIFPADRSGRLSTLRAYHLDQNAAWHGQTIANYASGIHLASSTFAAAINARGDAIATWMRRESAGGPWRVFARYGASGSDFGSTRQLANRGRTPVAAIDSSGAASVAFQQRSGEAIETMFAYRPASGYWTRPTAVSTTNSSLAFPPISLKTNAKGDFFVESEGQHLADGVLVADHRLTHCVEGTCGSDQVVQGPRGDQPMAVAVRPIGAVDILWTFGCATEECIPTGIRAARFWAQ